MPIVRLANEDLSSRGMEVQQMLRPLSRVGTGPAWDLRSGSSDFMIGVHDGARTTSNLRDWRFSTISSAIRGNYLEAWSKWVDNDTEYWYLNKAYLQLYFRDPSAELEQEFLMLHCDPNEP